MSFLLTCALTYQLLELYLFCFLQLCSILWWTFMALTVRKWVLKPVTLLAMEDFCVSTKCIWYSNCILFCFFGSKFGQSEIILYISTCIAKTGKVHIKQARFTLVHCNGYIVMHTDQILVEHFVNYAGKLAYNICVLWFILVVIKYFCSVLKEIV